MFFSSINQSKKCLTTAGQVFPLKGNLQSIYGEKWLDFQKLIYLLGMNYTFDFNEIFAEYDAFLHTSQEADEKNSSQMMPTYAEWTPEAVQDESINDPILQVQDPQQINHIWFDNHNEHEEPAIQKLTHHSRKDTADGEQICPPQLMKEQKRKRGFSTMQKNQTKNIPKNFGKAIIAFIQKHKKLVKQVIEKNKAGTARDFMDFMEQYKKQITTIADLRALWIDNPYESVIRTLSCVFLRKYSLNYIFNSRVCNYVSHIKYRQRFLEAIQAPNDFKHIKDF